MDNKVFKTFLSQFIILVVANEVKKRIVSNPTDSSFTLTIKDLVRDALSKIYELVKISIFVSVAAFFASFGLTPEQWSKWIFDVLNVLFVKVPYYMVVGLFKPIDFVLEGGKRKLKIA